jgi:hypothetical protein
MLRQGEGRRLRRLRRRRRLRRLRRRRRCPTRHHRPPSRRASRSGADAVLTISTSCGVATDCPPRPATWQPSSTRDAPHQVTSTERSSARTCPERTGSDPDDRGHHHKSHILQKPIHRRNLRSECATRGANGAEDHRRRARASCRRPLQTWATVGDAGGRRPARRRGRTGTAAGQAHHLGVGVLARDGRSDADRPDRVPAEPARHRTHPRSRHTRRSRDRPQLVRLNCWRAKRRPVRSIAPTPSRAAHVDNS